jgi:hypothetical protein
MTTERISSCTPKIQPESKKDAPRRSISCIALFDIMESPTLTLEEIKGNLCYYDAENPNNNLDCYDDEEERPKPRENCHCDNCFYGRDKLARYILSNND